MRKALKEMAGTESSVAALDTYSRGRGWVGSMIAHLAFVLLGLCAWTHASREMTSAGRRAKINHVFLECWGLGYRISGPWSRHRLTRRSLAQERRRYAIQGSPEAIDKVADGAPANAPYLSEMGPLKSATRSPRWPLPHDSYSQDLMRVFWTKRSYKGEIRTRFPIESPMSHSGIYRLAVDDYDRLAIFVLEKQSIVPNHAERTELRLARVGTSSARYCASLEVLDTKKFISSYKPANENCSDW